MRLKLSRIFSKKVLDKPDFMYKPLCCYRYF
jgi:hypothetical protein